MTSGYLRAALVVLGPTLTYRRQWYGEASAVLEFTARPGDVDVHGVDMITWNEQGRLTDFSVMVRPLRGLELLIALMREQLSAS